MKRIAAAPLTSLLIAVAIFATASSVYSLVPETPLAERPGFQEAMAELAKLDSTSFVVVTPPEQTEALDHIPAHLPASDAAPAKDAQRSRWSAIVAVGPRGASLPGFSNELARTTFGDIDVVRYGNPSGERVIFDLERDLEQVKVVLHGEPDLSCNVSQSDGLHCPGRPQWNRVGPARLTVNGAAWSATWAHPVTDRPLELTLPEVTLSDAIVLEAALDDGVARNGAPVELEMHVGERVLRYVRTANQGVYTVRVPTRAGSHEPVSLVIRTSADGQRHLGIRMRITQRQK